MISPELAFTRKNIAEIVWMAVGQFGSILLGILSIKVISSVGPQEYGIFVLLTSLGGMLTTAFFSPVEQGFIRIYVEYARDRSERSLFLHLLKRVLGWSLGVLLGLGIGASVILAWLEILPLELLFPSVILVIFTAFGVPITGMLNTFRRRKSVSITHLGERSLTVALLGALWFTGSVTLSLVVGSIALAAVFWTAVRWRLYRHSAGPDGISPPNTDEAHRHQREMALRVLRYGSPFIAWGLLTWLQISGERWIIGGMMTAADVGRFGLAAALIQNSGIVAFNVLSQYLSPVVYDKFSHPDAHVRKQAVDIVRTAGWYTLGIFLSVGLLLYFAGEDIIRFLSTEDYILSGSFLFLLSMGTGMFYVGQMLTVIGFGAQRPEIYLKPKIFFSVLSLAGYAVGCYYWGLAGVAGATLVVNTLYFFAIVRTNSARGIAEQLIQQGQRS